MTTIQAGAAQPIVASSQPAPAGAATPIAVVSDRAAMVGPARPVIVVTDGRPTIAGPALPVYVASGGAVIAGPPLPVVVVSGSIGVDPDVSNPSFALQNTTFTNDMGPDGYNWAQAGPYGPLMVDQYGKLITLSEDVGGNHTITYSNDGGVTWADGPSIGFITRGAADYNSADDRLEVLWLAQAATDGMLYRRYTPTRDGSNNITAWAAVGAGYTILDAQSTGTMEYQHPTIMWLDDAAYGAHGAVVCTWCCRNTGVGGTGNEIRSAMRILSNTADDLLAANWTHTGINSASTIGNAPLTATYTALLANATTGVPHVAVLRQADLSLFVGYHDGTTTAGRMGGSWSYRRATWAAGSNNWTALTAAAVLSNLTRDGTDTGYVSKGELLSKPRQDDNGNVYLGIATWKSNALGDTWGFAQITLADVVTLVDDYSANGAHSYAPTGDIDYDATADRVISSYITTTDQFAYVHLFDGLTADEAPVLAFNAAPVDIPLLHTRAIAGKLCMLFRDTNTPHKGWFGTLDWNV